jgi:hypothetical protein
MPRFETPPSERHLPARRPVPYALLNCQISFPNLLVTSDGVARILATASDTDILPDAPLMLVTEVSHWLSVSVPADAGFSWRVLRPIPARRNAFAQNTLQLGTPRRDSRMPCFPRGRQRGRFRYCALLRTNCKWDRPAAGGR